MKHRVLKRISLLATVLTIAFFSCGCSMMNSNINMSSLSLPGRKKEPEYQIPRQMVPVWSDAVLHQSGEPATRGFGGRLMFYGVDKHKPIQVEGVLVVYAWDDDKGNLQRAPDRKYVFPKEDLQKHYSASRLGHSYSFWLPWDEAGGAMGKMSLICRFVSGDGTELTSNPANVVLPGPGESSPFYDEVAGRDRNTQSRSDSMIQRTGYEQRSGGDPAAENGAGRETSGFGHSRKFHPGLMTSEIGVTQGFLHRNMQGPATQTSSESIESSAILNADELLDPSAESHSGAGRSTAGGHSRSGDESPFVRATSLIDEELLEDEVQAPDPPSTRLRPFESRVRTSRATRTFRDPVRKEPIRGEWLNGLPDTPRS